MNSQRWMVYWTCIYAANLVVPIWMAVILVVGWGWIGVGLVVVAFWLAGLDFCSRNPPIIRRIVLGGVFVGLSQVFPALQVWAGYIGISIAQLFGLAGRLGTYGVITGVLGGLLATAITGALLLATSLALGSALRWLIDRPRGKPKPLPKPLFDREMDA